MTLDEFGAFCTTKGIKYKYCKGHLGVKRGAYHDIPDPSLRHLIAISIYARNIWHDNKIGWFTLSSLAPIDTAIAHAVEYIEALDAAHDPDALCSECWDYGLCPTFVQRL